VSRDVLRTCKKCWRTSKIETVEEVSPAQE
jgi:hypothetical protein